MKTSPEPCIENVSSSHSSLTLSSDPTYPYYNNKGNKGAMHYVASDELTCVEVVSILGTAIGNPYLKWAMMSDRQMLSGLKMFKIQVSTAEGIVEMNASMHSGELFADYY